MSRPARLAPVLACSLLLAGCAGGSDVDGSVVEAEIGDACAAIPSAAALPSAQAIGSRPLLWKQCGVTQVSARYGHEAPDTSEGEHCTINIHDTGFQTPEAVAAVGAGEAVEHTKSMILGMSKMNVELLVRSREQFLAIPQMLAARGGPDHLPVVGQLSTGEPYVIGVPAKTRGATREILHAVIGDRYAMTIECTDKVVDHDSADALYRPYVDALHLDALP